MTINNNSYSKEKTICSGCGNEYVPIDGIKELEHFRIPPMFANMFCSRKCMDSFDKGDRRKEDDRAFQARRAYELNCWEKHERFSLSGHNPLKGERMEDYAEKYHQNKLKSNFDVPNSINFLKERLEINAGRLAEPLLKQNKLPMEDVECHKAFLILAHLREIEDYLNK